MKRAISRSSVGAAFLGAMVLLAGEQRVGLTTQEIMKEKLDHAQSVLEGLSLENYKLVAVHAAKLAALSEQAAWTAYDTPEYAQQSAVFRRNVQALEKAAKERNLDAAVLAYTKVTFSCVECHKYLRDRKVALR